MNLQQQAAMFVAAAEGTQPQQQMQQPGMQQVNLAVGYVWIVLIWPHKLKYNFK